MLLGVLEKERTESGVHGGMDSELWKFSKPLRYTRACDQTSPRAAALVKDEQPGRELGEDFLIVEFAQTWALESPLLGTSGPGEKSASIFYECGGGHSVGMT